MKEQAAIFLSINQNNHRQFTTTQLQNQIIIEAFSPPNALPGKKPYLPRDGITSSSESLRKAGSASSSSEGPDGFGAVGASEVTADGAVEGGQAWAEEEPRPAMRASSLASLVGSDGSEPLELEEKCISISSDIVANTAPAGRQRRCRWRGGAGRGRQWF